MKKSFLIGFFLMVSIIIWSQTVVDSNAIVIPSLDTILKTTFAHSPLLKTKQLEAESLDLELKLQNKQWINYIFIEGASNYGLFDQVVINETSAGGESSGGLLTKSEQIRYYGGVSLKLPLSEVTNRRNKKQLIHVSKMQWEYEMEQLHNELRQLVIEEYFQLQYLQESLKSFQSIYNTLEISYMKAEREVSNGRMDINDFALLASTTGKARDDLNKAKNNFYAQFNKMGILTGIPLNKLK